MSHLMENGLQVQNILFHCLTACDITKEIARFGLCLLFAMMKLLMLCFRALIVLQMSVLRNGQNWAV